MKYYYSFETTRCTYYNVSSYLQLSSKILQKHFMVRIHFATFCGSFISSRSSFVYKVKNKYTRAPLNKSYISAGRYDGINFDNEKGWKYGLKKKKI